ncbi:Lsr2 family protein, partial [Kitasatospora sp. NPDC056138]|uniref:histone-like nucleoid-structuring protein Lsr2 n=1 Tax=Kitasatospora sp. NPDC056138 TaxID=3345724 RepID=UPI0035DC1276
RSTAREPCSFCTHPDNTAITRSVPSLKRLSDDLDGSAAEETVVFALDGERYEIDLSAGNAAALRQALEPFVARARRIRGRSPRPGQPVQRPALVRAQTVRAWALEKGYEVGDRGRIPIWLGREYDQHCEAPAQAGWGDPRGSGLPVD